MTRGGHAHIGQGLTVRICRHSRKLVALAGMRFIRSRQKVVSGGVSLR